MKVKLSLLIIIALGFAIRISHVGRLPLILNRDEAALAYNAYLIKESGRDEWQRAFPITFESFGDYKLPGYIYTLAAFFSVLGISDLVVRLPSVLAGTGLIAAAFVIAKKFKFSSPLALLFSLVIALQPVFVFYSRMAWEANLALLLTVVSWYCLFLVDKSEGRASRSDLIGVGLMLLASFTYNSPLLYTPFFILALVIDRGVKQYQNWLVPVLGLALSAVFSGAILLPVSSQKSGITIFTDETVWASFIAYRRSLPAWAVNFIGNKFVYWTQIISKNLADSFSFRYLVANGGSHPWHNLPNHGHLTWSIYFLGLFGLGASLFQLAKKLLNTKNSFDQRDKTKLLVIYTLIFSLVPAVITVDAPHATRSLMFFFTFSLLAVKGLKILLNLLAKYHQQIWICFLLVLSLETSIWLKKYFIDYPQNQKMFKPGFDILIQELEQRFPDKEVAIVADGYQYILAAWYLKLDSSTYFETNVRQDPDRIGLRYGQQVDNYHFIDSKDDRSDSEQILVFWNQELDQWDLERL